MAAADLSADEPIPGVTFRPAGEGALGPLVRGKDWGQTALGPFEAWPQTLKGYLAQILTLPLPAIVFWGPELRQLYNDGYAVIMGPRHPEFLGRPYRECWPDTYPTIYPWMQRVLRGEVVEVDRSLIPVTRYGFVEEAFFSFTFTPLQDDQGRIAGILQLVTEMTPVVLADRRARALRSLASLSSRGVRRATILGALSEAAADLPLAVYWAPRRTARGTELGLEGAAGLELAALPPAVRDRLQEMAEEVVARNEARELDLAELLPGARSPQWPEPLTRALLQPIRRDRSEAPRGALLLATNPRLQVDRSYRDFLENVAGELAVALSADQEVYLAEQLALALDSAQLGSWRVDLQTGRLLLLERASAFLGLEGPIEEDLESVFGRWVHPDDAGAVREAIRRAVDAESPFVAEYRIRRADGAERWLRSWGKPNVGVDGAPLLTGVSLDVTDQVVARQRIEKLAADLGESVRARDEFLAIASHELRTPLASLRLQTESVQRSMSRGDPESFSAARVHRLVSQTDRQTRRLARLVDDMLDVGRLTTGKLSTRLDTVELCEVLRESAERLRPELDASGTDLRFDCPEPVMLLLDRERFEQVLVNLLGNALRYARRTPVTIGLRREGEWARVTVDDGGPGVRPEDRLRIFERFERAVDANEVSGLGLGLYISRQIVELHGGRIWVEDAPTRGARFVVELPLRPPA